MKKRRKKRKKRTEEEEEEEKEKVNYALLSKEDLVKLMAEKLNNPGKGNMRREWRRSDRSFQKSQDAALEEKKEHFLEEGGTLEDFKPAEDPVEAGDERTCSINTGF